MADKDFEPKIIGFFCNWCSYAGTDLAGVSRLQYPPNLRIVRIMCTGRISDTLICKALASGADGVLVCGCHPGECHYDRGNLYARRRVIGLKVLMDAIGLDSNRLRLEWVSASEGPRAAKVIEEFTKQIKQLGPSPMNGGRNGN